MSTQDLYRTLISKLFSFRNIVRETKASQKRLTVDEKVSDITLGDLSKPLVFDDLFMEVTFAESSALMSDEDTAPSLYDLEEWIANIQ